MVLMEDLVAVFVHVDANRKIDKLRPRRAKSHEEVPRFLRTAVNEGTDVDFGTLSHGEVSFRERENWLAKVIVVESEGILPGEDWKSFLVESSAGLENIGEDIIRL